MNIAFLQFSNTSSEKYNEMVKVNQSIIKKYCNIHCYDYIFENIPSSMILNDMFFHKFEMILNYIDKYDYLVWIDNDAVPINPNISIEKIIDEKHDVFISKDVMVRIEYQWLDMIHNVLANIRKQINKFYFNDIMTLHNELVKHKLPFLNWIKKIAFNPHGFCAGFFIIKSSEIGKSILKEALSLKELFKSFTQDDIVADQEALALIIQKYELNTKIFDFKFHGNMIYLESNKKDEFSYDEEHNFICHMYSLSLENRIKGLNIIKNNKFWKKYFEDSL